MRSRFCDITTTQNSSSVSTLGSPRRIKEAGGKDLSNPRITWRCNWAISRALIGRELSSIIEQTWRDGGAICFSLYCARDLNQSESERFGQIWLVLKSCQIVTRAFITVVREAGKSHLGGNYQSRRITASSLLNNFSHHTRPHLTMLIILLSAICHSVVCH